MCPQNAFALRYVCPQIRVPSDAYALEMHVPALRCMCHQNGCANVREQPVGTSLCLPDEPEPTKGRIMVLLYDDNKVRGVGQHQACCGRWKGVRTLLASCRIM
eukprot:1150459-Pelagomonas_calceolata.AAC.2